jgi:hypothetical protein
MEWTHALYTWLWIGHDGGMSDNHHQQQEGPPWHR